MVPPALLNRIDAWIAQQPEPRPSRPEALRQMAMLGLDVIEAGGGKRGLPNQADVDALTTQLEQIVVTWLREHAGIRT